MIKIIPSKDAGKTARKLKEQGKVIVVAGGCFDILHLGHIKFLEEAKKQGDFLFVILESDESVKSKKGEKRPINSQHDRAYILSALSSVNFVIPLQGVTTNQDYDTLMAEISPSVIATTQNDPGVKHKERQAKKIGGKVKFVIRRIGNISTSKLAGFSDTEL